MRIRLVAGGVVLLAVLLVAAGCGDSTMGRVTGKILVDGTPASGPSGREPSISFIPADGSGPTAGGKIKDGYYDVKASVGPNKVQIRVSRPTGQKKKLYPTPESPERDVYEEILPKQYNDETELTYEVRPGRNQKDWDLKTRQP
jgi:hypothetical protein